MAEQTENYVNDTLDESSKIDSTPYLKIAEHGRSSRTKALKLKIDDVVVAVDGTEFRSTSENLVDLLSSEEDGKWLLTIFLIYNIVSPDNHSEGEKIVFFSILN